LLFAYILSLLFDFEMATYNFISGKNWILSLAELSAYFQARQIKFKIQYFSREFFVMDFEKKLNVSLIADLGGTLKIGELKATLPTQTIKDSFGDKNKNAQKQIHEKIASSGVANAMAAFSEKPFFGVSVYCTNNYLHSSLGNIQRFVGSSIKETLAESGKKSQFMGFKDRKQSKLSHVEVIKKKMVENHAEVLLCIGKEDTWIATTTAVHNPFDFQKRDLYKPNQRAIFGMPPRLARMMVNLSSCNAGKTLLDPFCGVGTILQEALLEGAATVGLDINSWCVKAAEENLDWTVKEYELQNADFRVLVGEIGRLDEKVGLQAVDCIVSEPDLGPALKQFPTDSYAQKIIEKLEPLFTEFIEQAYRVLMQDGRLVLVTPYIKTRSGQPVIMPIDEAVKAAGFKRIYAFSEEIFSSKLDVGRLVHSASLIEMDERHKIGREIHILQK
jgi:tRNA G10  N-methylase Trm11